MTTDPLDDYIDAVSKALGLPIADCLEAGGAGQSRDIAEACGAGG